MSMTRRQREDAPSFDEPLLTDNEAWVRERTKRPFEIAFTGNDYHRDGEYNEDFGGFTGERLRDGYWMLNDSDD